MRFHTLLAAALLIAACHHAKAVQEPVAAAPAPARAEPPVRQVEAPVPVSANISAADELVKQCQLHFASEQQAPKFDFDQFELTSQDRDVLQQVAQCVTSGPLKGRKLELVGRADPRGTEEYNLGLGDRRARTVGEYLERLGVHSQGLTEKTRGALDASGNDDASWRLDRRVDLQLD